MERVQKRFTGRKPWKGVKNLSKACGFDPFVKQWASKLAVEVSLILEDRLQGEEDMDLLRALYAADLFSGHAGQYLRRESVQRASELIERMESVTEDSTLDDVRAVDAALQDWRILSVLAHLDKEGLRERGWEAQFQELHELQANHDYFRLRDVIRRRDPVEQARRRKKQRKYRKSPEGAKKIKAYWQKPDVKAKDAERKRLARQRKKNGVEPKEAPGQAHEDGALHPGLRASDLQKPEMRSVQGEAPVLPPEEASHDAAAE